MATIFAISGHRWPAASALTRQPTSSPPSPCRPTPCRPADLTGQCTAIAINQDRKLYNWYLLAFAAWVLRQLVDLHLVARCNSRNATTDGSASRRSAPRRPADDRHPARRSTRVPGNYACRPASRGSLSGRSRAAGAGLRKPTPLSAMVASSFTPHLDRVGATAVDQLPDSRLAAGQQHFTRPEHHQLVPKQHADVLRRRAAQTGVGLVRKDDLGIHRAG